MNTNQDKVVSLKRLRGFAAIVCDSDLTIISCNQNSLKLFRCNEDELVGTSIMDVPFIFVDKDGTPIPGPDNPIRLVVENKKPLAEVEIGILFQPSETVWCSLKITAEFDDMEEIQQCTLSFRQKPEFMEKRSDDRGFRRKEDKMIRQAKDEWEKTFDAIPDIITIIDSDMKIIRGNKTAHAMFGLKYGELTGRKCFEVFHDRNQTCAGCTLSDHFFEKKSVNGIIYNKKINKTFELNSAPIYNDEGKVERRVQIARDVTQQKEDEKERSLLSKAIQQAWEVIVVTDENGRIQYVNPSFEKMTGYLRSEVTGESLRVLKSGEYDPHFYDEMWDTLKEGKVWSKRLDNVKKDGTAYLEDVTISPVTDIGGEITNFVAVKRDVTREALLEKQLQQAMKMEAMGTLAGGIAHDFNNILSVMIGYGQIAQGLLSTDHPAQSDIDQILKAGDRAVDLVKQILTFSRQDEQDAFQLLDLETLLHEVLKLMRSSLPATIDLVYTIDKGCGMVMADSSQMHQVLMNLFTNAKHAMGGEYGRIHVKLSEFRVEKEKLPLGYPLLKPGKYLDLEVSDTGCGMDNHTKERIFDPFFSTKSKEHGTGLGLAVVHGIITNHGGKIAVDSLVGEGTTFHIYLPVSQKKEKKKTGGKKQPLYKGTERIMVVDDEEVVGQVVQNMLSKMGYEATLFTSSLEAVNSFRKNSHIYDLVFTDMTMPEMTGAELAREILTIRPELPVILATGFSEIIDKEKAERIGIKKFLFKPIKTQELSKVVREVLDDDEI